MVKRITTYFLLWLLSEAIIYNIFVTKIDQELALVSIAIQAVMFFILLIVGVIEGEFARDK